MTKREGYKLELQKCFTGYLDTGDRSNIRSLLTINSNLPGPRANLELADVFAELCGEMFANNEKKVWELCLDFCSMSSQEAPVNDSKEFLPFCGTAALGSMGSRSEKYRPQAFERLKLLANDSRWRIREAVSHALTMILEKFPEVTLAELESWLKKDNWLEM
ncbi:MAG TPA: hypothetical protein VK469_03295, partial [Candidatus Kapabacteria bacterium]|nr:hypothetical protein [Candidatus Kapabacteria bacterium]